MAAPRIAALLADIDAIQAYLALSSQTPSLQALHQQTAEQQGESVIAKLDKAGRFNVSEATELVQKVSAGAWPSDVAAKLAQFINARVDSTAVPSVQHDASEPRLVYKVPLQTFLHPENYMNVRVVQHMKDDGVSEHAKLMTLVDRCACLTSAECSLAGWVYRQCFLERVRAQTLVLDMSKSDCELMKDTHHNVNNPNLSCWLVSLLSVDSARIFARICGTVGRKTKSTDHPGENHTIRRRPWRNPQRPT